MSDRATVHPVPYHAQWASPELVEAIVGGSLSAAEDPLWRAYGAESPEEYAWWSWRLCGVACLRMALEYWRGWAPDSDGARAASAWRRGRTSAAGERLDGSDLRPVRVVRPGALGAAGAGPPASAGARRSRQLIASGHLVMLSVHPSIRELAPSPERRGGHLVLGVGADEDALVFHNPSGFQGRSQEFAPDRMGRPRPVLRGAGGRARGRARVEGH